MTYPNIEAERERAGMGKVEFAKALGVNPSTIKNWQCSKTEIPASKIVAMATLFNVTTDYLLGRTSQTTA